MQKAQYSAPVRHVFCGYSASSVPSFLLQRRRLSFTMSARTVPYGRGEPYGSNGSNGVSRTAQRLREQLPLLHACKKGWPDLRHESQENRKRSGGKGAGAADLTGEGRTMSVMKKEAEDPTSQEDFEVDLAHSWSVMKLSPTGMAKL